MDNKISESLEPYEFTEAVPFQLGLLAGAMADHADVDVEICQARAVERVEKTAEETLKNTVGKYDKLSLHNKYIHSYDGKATPILAPIWMITTEKNDNGKKKVYTFAINGQTGKLTCDAKPDRKNPYYGEAVYL